ncbi:ABC transporter permease [Levilactobacillus tujiorum]|nr:ABC transporter permease [Levilactobacillus tujiorum]MCH5463572.1 ABC transporter permease [Levilactobacillus tujiorum]
MQGISDTWLLAERLIKHNLRSPDTVITVVLLPIMMLLMFVYLFGSAMRIPGVSQAAYVNYVLPGILLMTIGMGSAYTALRINQDKSTGMFDRFKSLPISRAAVLSGQALSSVIFMLVSTLLVLGVGFLTGFRSHASVIEWGLAVLLLIGFASAITWLAVPFGLAARSVDGASTFSYVVLLLIFVSSAFSTTAGIPKLVRWFAEHQPMTDIIVTLRRLLMSQSLGNHGWLALAWIAGITLISFLLSVRLYRQVN